MIAKAIRAHEVQLARGIVETVDPPLLARCRSAITEPRESRTTLQSWLWAAHPRCARQEPPPRIATFASAAVCIRFVST